MALTLNPDQGDEMDVFRLVLRQQLFNQEVENVLHFGDNRLIGTSQGLAENFDAFLTTYWSAVQTEQLKYTMIRVQKVSPADEVVFEMTPSRLTGQMASAPGSANLAVVYSLRSNTTNRRRNGRIFLPGTRVISMDTEGRLPISERPLHATMAAALLSEFSDNPITSAFQIGVYSKAIPPGMPGGPRDMLFTHPALIKVNTLMGVQRRRQVGVGS